MSTSTLKFDSYSETFGGEEITTNTHDLSEIWDGDYKFEDISDPDTGGLSWYSNKIEIQSRSATNWTKVRLSREDGEKFDLKDFTYRPEGAHTYKIVNPSGDEYVVNSDNSMFGGMGDEVNTNTLEDKFSDISYVDFYSRAIKVSEESTESVDSVGPGTETTLDLDTYSTSYAGNDLTTNTHNLSTIWDGDYKFEDISDPDTGGLTWWSKKIEVQSRSATNWTKVRLSREDGGNFDLKDFTYQSEGAHTYKIVNPSGDEYVVNTDSSEWGGIEDEVNTNTLEDSFPISRM